MKTEKPNRTVRFFSILVTCIVFPVAAILWHAGEKGFAISLGLFGVSLGPCLALYGSLPAARKQLGRRIVLLTGGLSIMAFSILGKVNMDLEGFFMLLFLGTAGAAFGHTVVTVLVGPLFFGRFLCGWAAGAR